MRRITVWGMVGNALLMLVKFGVGFVFHSQACVADALHSFSDFFTDIAVLVGLRFWSAPADRDHPLGHQRIEVLITMFIGIFLGACAIDMIYRALESIAAHHNAGVPSLALFGVALLSIVLKEMLYRWTVAVARRCGSPALHANAWHHRSDAVSSIPVAVVAVIGRIWPQFIFLDSIAAIIVASLLLHTAWTIAWPCLKELSDQGVSQRELDEIRRLASSIPGVMEVHKLRTRHFGNGILLDLHILVDRNMTVEKGHRICDEAAAAIRSQMPSVVDILTHLEPDSLMEKKHG
ncbi:MAG: cation transporter [Victivallales bacterium]|nr:cation transporter [Victivallales bacterium]